MFNLHTEWNNILAVAEFVVKMESLRLWGFKGVKEDGEKNKMIVIVW